MITLGRMNTAIYRNMQAQISGRLAGLDINSGQYDFFLVISRKEGISQKQLSEYLYIGKSTTAKAVKQLVARGYVEKQRDTQDRRVEHLYLTQRGRDVAPLVQEMFQENLDVAARGLSQREHQQLLELMERVLANLVAEGDRKGEQFHE